MRVTSPHRARADEARPWAPRIWAAAGAVAGLAITFLLDRATDAAPVQHLYYLPILLAAAAFGFGGGIAAAVAAIALYHVANPHLLTFRYEDTDAVQIALFLAVGLVAAKVARDARRLRALATTDDLTGLHNLRSFEARLAAMVRDAARTGAPLALFVLDVDRLKSLNDTHGHLAGAAAVRTVGRLIHAHAPTDAVACRYGGDEFVVALARCDRARARQLAGELRAAVRAAAPILAGIAFPAGVLSISVGVACLPPVELSHDPAAAGEALFAEADAALYVAKAAGRDRVHLAPPHRVFPRAAVDA